MRSESEGKHREDSWGYSGATPATADCCAGARRSLGQRLRAGQPHNARFIIASAVLLVTTVSLIDVTAATVSLKVTAFAEERDPNSV